MRTLLPLTSILGAAVLCGLAAGQSVPLAKLSDGKLAERIRTERDQPIRARNAALAELRKRKSAAARKLMLALFGSETAVEVRYKLLNAVMSLEHSEVQERLIATLRDSEMPERLRRLAGWGLLKQGKTGKAALIEEFAAGDSTVQRLTSDLLGRLVEDPAAVRALRSALSDADERLRQSEDDKEARDAVYERMRALRGAPADGRYKKWLVEVGSPDWPLAIAVEAAHQLMVLGHKKARAVALSQVGRAGLNRSENAAARASLAATLARDGSRNRKSLEGCLDLAAIPGTTRALNAELKTLSSEDREALFVRLEKQILSAGGGMSAEAIIRRRTAVRIAGMFQGAASTRALLRAAADEDVAVAVEAIQIVVSRDRRVVQPALQKQLGGARGLVRAELLIAVHRWQQGDRKWLDRLEGELDPKRHLACRAAALDLLGSAGRLSVLEDAHQLLGDSAWPLRSAAVKFCLAVPHKSSIPLLIARAAVESGRLADEVQMALEVLTQRRFAKAEYWQRWWDEAGAAFVMDEAVIAKGRPASSTGGRGATYHGLAVSSERVCFVVDVSGSMSAAAGTDESQTRLQLAKRSLITVAKGLDPSVRVNVISFSGRVGSWEDKLRVASAEAIADLETFVEGMQAGGATNVFGALEMAFADLDVDTIYLLSDGAPSAGAIQDPELLSRAVISWNRSRRIVVHTIAIGLKSEMMRRIADQSGGTYVERK